MGNALTSLLTTLSQESDSAGTVHEIEYVHFYELADIASVKGAVKFIEQEQWHLRKPAGTVRVRKATESNLQGDTPVEGVPSYWLTSKLNLKGVVGRPEVTVEVNEDLFDHFRQIADNGWQKLRCIFPIPGTEGTFKDPDAKFNGALCWEVDLFKDKDGQFCPWVKADLEVPSLLADLPAFPLQVKRAITEPYGKRTAEDQALIDELFNEKINLTWDDINENTTAVAPPTD